MTKPQQHKILGLAASLWLAGLGLFSTAAKADNPDPASLWADFNHYVRIARPDLADAAGNALINTVAEEQLLDVVEAGEYQDYDQTFLRALRMDATLAKTAQTLAQLIHQAQAARSRQPQRIRADIAKLGEGIRANHNATRRLKAAGQFACPYLLETLLDDRQAKLHPYVLAAMTAIGRPMTYPLSVALPHLETVQMGQVARVLAEIGYPDALPYLKQVLESKLTDDAVTLVVQAAYDRLAQETQLPEAPTAAELFLFLAEKYYRSATDPLALQSDVDPETGMGLIWQHSPKTGLVMVEVPGQILGDALAMQAARHSLLLDPKLDSALSLWLMANLRRENRLPQGMQDKSYSNSMHPADFYLEMAGPWRQHDVLSRALDDNDPQLALDAIAALTATAGTDALLNQTGSAQPLLRALSHPDRKVRFSAAFAIADGRTRTQFPGSHRVVPVLAEALRQSDSRYALVLGSDQDSVNALTASIQRLGFQTYGALSLDDLADEVNASPGIDLIVVEQSAQQIESLRNQTAINYKLANVPIVAIMSVGVHVELTRQMSDQRGIRSVIKSSDQTELSAVIDEVLQPYSENPFSPEEAYRYASRSLELLRKIAVERSGVFDVADAQPALIEALTDKRQSIAEQAAGVLAMLDNPAAQQAICEAALDVIRSSRTRVALFESLAESAAFFGSRLTESQSEKLLDTVKTSHGDLAVAAAKAHGALALPTANLVEMISQ